MAFVKQIFKIFTADAGKYSKGFLRNKNSVEPSKTDVELFQSYPLNDLWEDASLVSVYAYMRQNRHLVIPPSWQETIDAFDLQLFATDS